MNRVAVIILTSALSLSAFAFSGQDKPVIKTGAKHTATRPISDSPVTEGEAEAVFRKMEKAMKSVLNVSSPGSSVAKANSTVPMTRDQVIAEFSRIFDMARPKFRFVPPPVQVDSKRLTITDAHAKAALEKLIRLGFVAKVGPVSAAPSPTLSATEFGDAIGFFMARMAELTHTPTTKWSPYLQRDR